LPANEYDRAQGEALCHSAQERTGGMLEMVFADQGDTSEQAQDAAHNSKTTSREASERFTGSCLAAETMCGGTFVGVVVAVSSLGT